MKTNRRQFLSQVSLATASLAVPLSSRALGHSSSSQVDASIEVFPAEPIGTIAPAIYGHFIEHLGGVIYDGVWVGEKSKIPNQHGIRQSFIDAMRAIKAPVLRWPGGCFADSYDWRDGIGPRDQRPQRSAFWGQQDSNAFGLREFMATCRAIGCEPYLAANLRSLPARDFYQWVEYCNAPSTPSPEGGVNALAAERARNGDPEPFNVRYWGVGNEMWGCGGSQTPEEYGELYRRFTEWLPHFDGPSSALRLIACGANGDDVPWVSGTIRAIGAPHAPYGFSTHYYTSGDAKIFAAGDALAFDEEQYYDLLARGSFMERIITDTWAALGTTDVQHRTKIVMDEWGAWYGKGTMLGPRYNLSQQSTMRDALLSAITLDIFQRHADKVAMANVAQTINCLHSLMLARENNFSLTPTYHVFKMYMQHRDCTAIRSDFSVAAIPNPAASTSPVGGNSAVGSIAAVPSLAGLSGSASMKGKTVTLTVVNPHLHAPVFATVAVSEATIASASGYVLASADIHDHNSFDHPEMVKPRRLQMAAASSTTFVHEFPAASVTALTLQVQ